MKVIVKGGLRHRCPKGVGFPCRKYALLRERVVEAGIAVADDLHVPPPVTDR